MSYRNHNTDEIVAATVRGCRIAVDATHNLIELIDTASSGAFVEMRRCELELDEIELCIDDSIAAAITRVSETTARTLLACLKMSTDVERIGDLLWWSAQRLKQELARHAIARQDRAELRQMAVVLEEMLVLIVDGFLSRHDASALEAMRKDTAMDDLRCKIFDRHLHGRNARGHSTNVLLVAQAFERAGDHVKNLAESVLHLIAGQSMLHKAAGRLLEGQRA